jgi:hypothetical protein
LSSLHESGLCYVIWGESNLMAVTQSWMSPPRERYTLVFNSDLLDAHRHPFDGQSPIFVCLQSFLYLMARVLGWKMLSSDCLGALQRGDTEMDEYSVWGDSQVYRAVKTGHMLLCHWHERTQWWNSLTLSPCKSSYQRRENHERNLLSGFDVVVAKMVAADEVKQNATDNVLMSSFVREGVGLFHGAQTVYKSLSGDQVSLCEISASSF